MEKASSLNWKLSLDNRISHDVFQGLDTRTIVVKVVHCTTPGGAIPQCSVAQCLMELYSVYLCLTTSEVFLLDLSLNLEINGNLGEDFLRYTQSCE